MRISLEDLLYEDLLTEIGVSLESISTVDTTKSVYILLTDTKTTFSKVSKMITGDPYNHISIMLNYDFDNIFTFSIRNGLNKSGGFLREDRQDLRGSRYSLYKMSVTDDVYLSIRNRIDNYFKNVNETTYNHFGIINAVLKQGVFKDEDKSMICSQFVATVLRESGIELFKNRPLSTVRPYEFVKSKLLKFVERGTIK